MPQRSHSSTSYLYLAFLLRSSNYHFLVGFFFLVLLHLAEIPISLLPPFLMNSFYIQFFVVSSKDISESMDFSDIQSKFCKKKIVFLICFEGASYMLTQLWFVCCSHTLFDLSSEVLIPSPSHCIYSSRFFLYFFWRKLPLPPAQD